MAPPFNAREITVAEVRITAEKLEKSVLGEDDSKIVDELLSLTKRREWSLRSGKSSWGEVITIWPDAVRLSTKEGDGRVSRSTLSPTSALVVTRLSSAAESLHELHLRLASAGAEREANLTAEPELPRAGSLVVQKESGSPGQRKPTVAVELETFGVDDGSFGAKSFLINGVSVGVLPRSSDQWTRCSFVIPNKVLSNLAEESLFQITSTSSRSDAFKIRSVRLVATLADGRRLSGRASGAFTSSRGWSHGEGTFFRSPSDSGPLNLDVPEGLLAGQALTPASDEASQAHLGPDSLPTLAPGDPSEVWAGLDEGSRAPRSLDEVIATTPQGNLTTPRRSALKRGPPGKPPPPDEVANVVLKTRAAFSEELANVHDDQARAKVVADLLEIADSSEVGPSDRFAAIEVALEVATKGGAAGLVHDVLHARSEWFEGQVRSEPMLQFLTGAAETERMSPSDAVPCLLELSKDALATGSLDCAVNAADMAVSLLKKLPTDRLGHWMPLVRTQVTLAKDTKNVHDAGIAARARLEGEPDDPSANLRCGLSDAVAGNWTAALRHLQKCDIPGIKAVAVSEQSLEIAPASQKYFEVAGQWWEVSIASEGSAGENAPESIPPVVRNAIQAHARDLYQKSLQLEPGLASPLDRKLATTRAVKTSSVTVSPANKVSVAVQGPEPLLAAKFDEELFLRIERKRADLFEDLERAVRSRDQSSAPRIRAQLANVRVSWCGAMHVLDRDSQLAEREMVLKDVLRAYPDFADGWLCDCYLRILKGDQSGAKVSLHKAETLFNNDRLQQLYSVDQLIDCASAAILLGDGGRAEKARNALKKDFPNNPGLLVLEARVYMNKSMFSDAKRNFDKLLENGGQYPEVMADLAWLLAAAPVESIRDAQRASEAVTEAMASQQGPQWLAWRAKAALLAGQGRWDDAINAIDRAANQAPLFLADEFERQRKKYEAREDYWIERKK